MSWNLSTALRSFTSTPNSRSKMTRRRLRPSLDFLECRQVLSTFTWTGGANDGNWNTGGNWQGGTAPKSGEADLVFPFAANDQTITLQSDDAGLLVKSVNVQGGNYTFQGPSSGANQTFSLAANAVVTVTGTLTINKAPGSATGVNSLALDLQGPVTVNGGNKLILHGNTVNYAGNPSTLRTLTVDGSILQLGTNANFAKSSIVLASSGFVVVLDGFTPTAGSLTGNGSLQLSINGDKIASTGFVVDSAAGVNDVLGGTGVIRGPGGTFTKKGAGSFTVSQIDPVNVGDQTLVVQAGTFKLQGIANITKTTVAAGATYITELRGTTAGKLGAITATGTTSPVTLAGNLGVTLGTNYTPNTGDVFTIVSSPSGITGQFANVANGGIVSQQISPFRQFRVNYTNTAVTLTALAPTQFIPTTTTMSSSLNPAPAGQSVQYTATVKDATNVAPTQGYFSFWYTDDFVTWTQLGNWQQVNANGQATTSRTVPLGVTVEAVVGFYHDVSPQKYNDSWSQDSGSILFQIPQYSSTTQLALDTTNAVLRATISSPNAGSPPLSMNGAVLFTRDGVIIGAGQVVNGVATITLTRPIRKGTVFTAQFFSDYAYSIGGSTATLTA